jgi:HTH-type transcriptional regulator, glycine betaine synthesis regulator
MKKTKAPSASTLSSSDELLDSDLFSNEDGEESSRVPQDLEFGEGNYEAIRHTCEGIGQIIESWGFKKIMGMTWAFLYLCPEPASAKDICKALNISPALVSITLQDLLRWQVVKKISPLGKRRDYYTAEHDMWKMLNKILENKERPQVENVKQKLDLALAALVQENRTRPDLKSKRTCQFQRVRIEDLQSITHCALNLIDNITQEGMVDIGPINGILKPYQFYAQQIQASLKN